jgi:hypothetical protein
VKTNASCRNLLFAGLIDDASWRDLAERSFQRLQYPVDVVLVAVMHQRQAHHAIVRVDAEVGDQAMRVKIAVLGAYT